jgi:hypothetical protein
MKSLFAGGIAAFALTGGAQAEDWVGVAISRNSVVGIDRSTVARDGDGVRFSYVRVARPGTAPYDHARSTIEMNCEARTYREVEASARRADGTVVETWSAARPKPIPATAIIHGAAEAACSDRWRGQTAMNSFEAFRRAALVYFD